MNININFVNSTLLILVFFLTLMESIIINDDFMLCKQNMNRPPINLNRICVTEKMANNINDESNDWFNSIPKTKFLTDKNNMEFNNMELAILAKSQYFVSGDAFECKQTNFEMEYSENFFGAKHSIHRAFIQQLKKEECIRMVTTNKCGKNEMKCNMEKCEYKELPNDEDNYSWLSYRQITYSHCEYKIHKIHYHTKEEMAFSPKCQAQSGFCELAESVVYWNEETIHKCPFHYVGHYNFTHALNGNLTKSDINEHYLIGKTDQISLGLLKLENFCGIKMLTTYEGLFVISPKDMDLIKSKLINKGKLDGSNLEQNEIEKINLAQEDYRQLQNIIYVNEIHRAECKEFAEILQLYAAAANNIYFKLDNFEGKTLYFYSYMGQVFRPDCTQIKEISTLNNQSKCYRDVPIKVIYDNQQLNMYLTSNGLIVDTSIEIDCPNHPKYMPLPNIKQILVFQNKNFTLVNRSTVRFEEIKYKNDRVIDFVFKHNSLVLTGSDIAKAYGPVVMSEEHEGSYIAKNERYFDLQTGGNMILRSVNWLLAKIISYVEKIIMISGVILIISVLGIILYYSINLLMKYRLRGQLANANFGTIQEQNAV